MTVLLAFTKLTSSAEARAASAQEQHMVASILGLLLILFVSIMTLGLVWVLRRAQERECLATTELLEELDEVEKKTANPSGSPDDQLDDWQRDSDWWKKSA